MPFVGKAAKFCEKDKEDSVQEFTVYLSKAQGEPLDNRVTMIKAKDLWKAKKFEELFEFFIASLHALLKSPEKDAESMFNLLFHLIKLFALEKTLLPQLVKSIQENSKGHFQICIKVLFNLYYSFEDGDSERAVIYEGIIHVTMNNNYPKVLVEHIDLLPFWMTQWNVADDQKRRIYDLLSQAFQKDYLLEKEEYKCILSFLTLTPKSDENSLKKCERAYLIALKNEEILDFQQLLDSCSWAPSELVELVKIISSGNKDGFNAYKKSHSGFESKYGCLEACEKKIRVISLLKIASENLNKEITYEQLAQFISSDVSDVELNVIEAVRSGSLDAHMNQAKETVVFRRVAFVNPNEEDHILSQIEAQIARYKESISGMQKLVEKVKKDGINIKKDNAPAVAAQ